MHFYPEMLQLLSSLFPDWVCVGHSSNESSNAFLYGYCHTNLSTIIIKHHFLLFLYCAFAIFPCHVQQAAWTFKLYWPLNLLVLGNQATINIESCVSRPASTCEVVVSSMWSPYEENLWNKSVHETAQALVQRQYPTGTDHPPPSSHFISLNRSRQTHTHKPL